MVNKSNLDIIDSLPISTVHQARLQLYQATKKPRRITRRTETQWGSVTVEGKIGQVHAGLMEALFTCAEKTRTLETGQVQLLVDPYKVRTTTYGGDQGSHEGIWSMLRDLMGVVIEFEVPEQRLKALGHILEDVGESPMTRINPLTGKDRPMWRVTVAKAFVRIMAEDLPLHYDPKPIARLATGIAQAVARHVATHKHEPNGGWHIDGLIQAAGGGQTTKQLQNQRTDLKSDSEGLKAAGLLIENGRVKRL